MTGAGPLRRWLDVADLSAEPTDPSEVDRLAAEVAEMRDWCRAEDVLIGFDARLADLS
jgi:hypothetical protein